MNELKILKGDPVDVRYGLKVHPLTLGDISDIGENVYHTYIRTFRLDKSMLNKLEGIPQDVLKELYKCNDLETLYYFCSVEPTLTRCFMESLEIFLKSKISMQWDRENDTFIGIFIENEYVSLMLDNDLFVDIKQIIWEQNFLKNSKESSFKPANTRAKELLDKLNKAKANIQKQNKDEGLSLKEVISIVANYSSDLNIKSVWELTVNQLYECYLRLLLWDDYHNKYLLVPHTTDTQSLDIKHWVTDINKLNN